ncbi:GH1 family beta-glucosidase [Defluviimonas sp. WL0050]|uniref:Beta-glucosidase n=1 Tax=Albidovulum litorale TaxID=2984134 RepID=A0ABT2ZQ20_9RHOB|nr:GH1 family beta-glucosidase [Defluviimonas sp. WL0050]MCV2873249.1 GH1 family beta-glucosidase [Defluviimonas sp. WL0050]
MLNAADTFPLEERAASLRLPEGFVLGAATAAYQIEGAIHAEGKGESIWDSFTRRPGVIVDGTSGETACDSYHRWSDDIALLREMGLGAYRFSLGWARMQPGGQGALNAAGVAYYDRLIDGLLEAGIAPYVTLYHWDLPQELQERGGWYSRETSERFADYAELAVAAIGDRVGHWTTLNEPWTFGWFGHAYGEDAPGLADGVKGGLAASHHALLAHGMAVPRIRSAAPGAEVGIVLDLNVVSPASDAPEDVAAAKRFEGVQNRWYLDAVFRGEYPADILELCADLLPEIRQGDTTTIAQALDYLGVNIYRRSVIGAGAELPPLSFARVNPPGRYTATGWEIWPRCIRDALDFVHREYGPKKLLITENGMATPPEVPGSDGQVHDPERARYLVEHLEHVAEAARAGVPVKGYFAWTLMDNFEWASGYTVPFGLAHVDPDTRDRRLKLSGEVFGRIARNTR